MLWRAALIWMAILALGNLNGALRELVLRPKVGPGTAHILSTLLLSTLVALTTWFTIPWISPAGTRDGIAIGALWGGLTLAFEFLVGHYGFHKPWAELLADYNLAAGRIWPLVLLVTLARPEVCRRLRG